jgi:hypothetical protein
VSYVEGAIYLRIIWALVLVTMKTNTSKIGCWVLKGACGAKQREAREDMIKELYRCWIQAIERDCPACSLFVRTRSDIGPGKDVVDWIHYYDDPCLERNLAEGKRRKLFGSKLLDHLVPVISSGRHSSEDRE